MEQEEYTKEEINWSYIEFVDNQDILDMIEKVFFLIIVLLVVYIFHYINILYHFSQVDHMH